MGHLNRRYTSSPQIFYPNFILIEIMIELSTIRDLVAIFGVVAGFSYYVLTVRINQRNQELSLKAQQQTLETRQAQLLMSLYQRWQEPEFQDAFYELLSWEWRDYDDFWEKYGWASNPDKWR